MAQDLTTSSGSRLLPAVSVADPATMLLLAEWLTSQLGAVSDLGAGRTVVDRTTRQITARVPTIPKSKMPTGPQRAAIAQRITELQQAVRPGPTEDTVTLIGELIQEFAPARLDPKTVSIKAEAYMDAVEDLPAWTLREAIYRWHRGQVTVSDPSVLEFAPKPFRLKAIADGILVVAKGQAIRLQRILDAEAEEELSDAELQANSARMSGLLAALNKAKTENRTPEAGTAHTDRLQALSTLREAEAKARSSESEEGVGHAV